MALLRKANWNHLVFVTKLMWNVNRQSLCTMEESVMRKLKIRRVNESPVFKKTFWEVTNTPDSVTVVPKISQSISQGSILNSHLLLQVTCNKCIIISQLFLLYSFSYQHSSEGPITKRKLLLQTKLSTCNEERNVMKKVSFWVYKSTKAQSFPCFL